MPSFYVFWLFQENLFSVFRASTTTPTPLIFKRKTKLIALGHLFANPKGASYENDDANYLVTLSDGKKKSSEENEKLHTELNYLIEEDEIMKQAREDREFLLTTPMFQDYRGFTDAATLGYGGEYFLRAVTMKTSKCDKCLQFYTTKNIKDEKVCNTLVQFKEFKEGSMVRLNEMGDWLFRVAEEIFKLYR